MPPNQSCPPEHALDLERFVDREACLLKGPRVLGEPELLLAEQARVRIGPGNPSAWRDAIRSSSSMPAPRDLARAVARGSRQQALDQQQHQPVLGGRLAQLLESAALAVQLVEELDAS